MECRGLYLGPRAAYNVDLARLNRWSTAWSRDTDAKDLTPGSTGLEAIAEGFRTIGKDDHDILRREVPVYDALYAYCRSMTTTN